MQKRFNPADVYSLYILSLRNIWWRSDRRDIRMTEGYFWKIVQAIGIWMMPIYFVVILVVFVSVMISIAVPWGIEGNGDGSVAKGFLVYIVVFAIWLYISVKPSRLRFNLQYRKSAWWENTGIKPNEIRKDRSKGKWGEYITSMSVELNMKRTGLYGKVFNNVIVPKRNGDFTEIDLVFVNEMGIHVIETKARAGTFYGSYTGKTWVQQIGSVTNEAENPLYQNFQHCNFLNEYIYEKLPNGRLKTDGITDNLINVVLFCSPEIGLQLSGEFDVMSYFCGAAERGRESYRATDLKKYFKNCFDRQEVDMICHIMDEIPRVSEVEREAMVQQRNAAYQRGEFRSLYKYFAAEVHFLVGKKDVFTLCRTDGYYNMFQHQSGWYFADPGSRILLAGKQYTEEDYARGEFDWIENNLGDVRNEFMMQPYKDPTGLNNVDQQDLVNDGKTPNRYPFSSRLVADYVFLKNQTVQEGSGKFFVALVDEPVGDGTYYNYFTVGYAVPSEYGSPGYCEWQYLQQNYMFTSGLHVGGIMGIERDNLVDALYDLCQVDSAAWAGEEEPIRQVFGDDVISIIMDTVNNNARGLSQYDEGLYNYWLFNQGIRDVSVGEATCPQCGAQLKSGQKFCSKCGARRPDSKQEQQEPLVCPTCGSKLRTDAHFCSRCGTKVS